MKRILASAIGLTLFSLPALADPLPDVDGLEVKRTYLGNGRLLQNDLLGDGQDRWRTGSYSVSIVQGYQWHGSLPSEFGQLLEYRFLAEVIQPEDIVTPSPSDRPYAQSLSFGLHSHFQTARGNEISFGGDLVVIGPQTGLDSLQTRLHELLGEPTVSDLTLAGQIDDTVRPSATFELGRNIEVASQTLLRPFVEMRGGVENLARIGFDLTIGAMTQGDMFIRDPITGQRYRAIRTSPEGLSFVLGADIAKVWDSVYLPEDRGYQLTDSRDRVRAGLNWQGKGWSLFYGVTWLGKEFVDQRESQWVGAVNLNVKF